MPGGPVVQAFAEAEHGAGWVVEPCCSPPGGQHAEGWLPACLPGHTPSGQLPATRPTSQWHHGLVTMPLARGLWRDICSLDGSSQ